MVRKFAEEQSQQGTNNLKAIDNKINEIEAYLVKLKKKQENIIKYEKPSFKPIIISKDEMDKFEVVDLKKQRNICKKQLV